MPQVTSDGASIRYERDEGIAETARDDGPGARDGVADRSTPVVFLQDLGYGRWMWRWQREAVRSAGYRVIAPDTRGTGRSGSGLSRAVARLPRRLRAPLLRRVAGYSVEGLANDLEAVLADASARTVHLVGAGLGGMVALEHALERDRAASLTLLGTSAGGPDAVSMPGASRQQLFAPEGATERDRRRERLRPAFTERFTNRNPHLVDRIVEWGLEQDAVGPARDAQAAALYSFDASDRLARLRVPTLLLHGTADRVVPVENGRAVHRRLPEGRLEEFAGAPHLACIERDDDVTDRLLSFLDEQS